MTKSSAKEVLPAPSNPDSTLMWTTKNTQATRLSSVVLLVAQTESARKADDAKWSWCSVRDMHKFTTPRSFLEKSGGVTPLSVDMKAVVKANLRIFTPWMRFGGCWVRVNLAAVQAMHVLIVDAARFDVICDLQGRVRQAFRVQDMSCTDFVEACLKANGLGCHMLGPYSHDNFTENRFEKWSVLLNAQFIETINSLKEDIVVPERVFRMNVWMNNGRQLDGLVVTAEQPSSAAKVIRGMMNPKDQADAKPQTLTWESRWNRASERRARNAARATPY